MEWIGDCMVITSQDLSSAVKNIYYKEVKMKNKLDNLVLCLVLSIILVGYSLFVKKKIQENLVIKDPIFIMEDMSVVEPKIQGLYGVVSKKEFNKFLHYTYRKPIQK